MDSPHDDLATEFDEAWELIRNGRQRAWTAVNAVMIETYEAIGAWLVREVGSDPLKLHACAEALRAARCQSDGILYPKFVAHEDVPRSLVQSGWLDRESP